MRGLPNLRPLAVLPSFFPFRLDLFQGSSRDNIHLANHIAESLYLEGEVPWQHVPFMLRITIDEGEDAVVLRLEGQLIGPWVEDVEQCWRKAFETLGSRSVQVDLSAVNFVDASGGALLIRMHEAGFRLAGNSPATGHLLDQVQDGHLWGEN